MLAIASRHFRLSAMLIAAFSVSLLAKPGQAYTPEQQQACSGDAFRLCGADIPDIDRITACMIRNKSQLSTGCRAFFKEPEAAAPAGQPLSLTPASSRKPSNPKSRKDD
jgi:hypothetical protein